MNKVENIDALDRKILALLMRNAKRPYTEIAQQLFVSGGTIHVRMNKLIEAGIVEGYTLRVNAQALGYDVTSFLGVYLEKSSYFTVAVAGMRAIPEIVAAHYTTGLYSIFIKVICRDTRHLREVLQKIQTIEGIQRTETFIALEENIERPINLLTEEEAKDLAIDTEESKVLG